MILVDSNLLIYAASGNFPKLTGWFLNIEPVVSAVTILEVLGYHRIAEEEKKY